MSETDPITREIVKNALASAADEMAVALYRTAYSTVVRDCLELFLRANTRRNRIRTMIIDASRFQVIAMQENLFSDKKKEDVQLARALDHIRQKYGFAAIKPAV